MSVWESYVEAGQPTPSDLDRARLQRLIPAGATLPDAWWDLVRERQGQVLEDAELDLPGQGDVAFGVLLFAISPERAGSRASYTVERSFANMRDHYPAGLLPFADDTGGNNWAFDFRQSGSDPAIVFIDHEVEGEDGVFPAAPDFATFLARIGAPAD